MEHANISDPSLKMEVAIHLLSALDSTGARGVENIASSRIRRTYDDSFPQKKELQDGLNQWAIASGLTIDGKIILK